MKLKQVVLSMLSITGLASCASLKSNPINMGTTKIVYSEHSNSGLAIQTRYEFSNDSLIWEYDEARNNCHLRDVSKYSPEDFKRLLSELSSIKFSAKDAHDFSVGGSGWGISFENSSGSYYSFNNKYKLSGDYLHVMDVLKSFINNHQPNGYRLFKQCQSEPHESAMFGEFVVLPEALQPFSVP